MIIYGRLPRLVINCHSLLLSVTIFLLLLLFFLRPPTDPDLGWHLKYGEQIIEQHQLPRLDTFSVTMTGFAWADSYWLSETLMYGLYKVSGFFLLSLVFALFATGAFISVISRCRLSAATMNWGDIVKTLALLFIAVILVIPFVGIRPQTLSLLLFSVTLLLLCRRRYHLLLPLFLLWANTHAGFVLGLAVAWLWFICGGLESWNIRKIVRFKSLWANSSQIAGSVAALLRSSVYPILCTLVTLINPYGISLWRTIMNDAGSLDIKQNIAEWQPVMLRSELGLIYLIFLAVVFLLLGRNIRRERIFETVILLVFAFLSLGSIRHIPLFVVLALPFVFRSLPSSANLTVKYLSYWLLITFAGVALYAAAGFAIPLYSGQWTNRTQLGFGGYPYGALKYLKNSPLSGVGLNTYGWGGYFLWNLPGYKSFIDGRMPGWRQGDNPSLFSEYLKAVNLKPGWKEVLEKYGVRWVVLEKTVPLAQALLVAPGWRKEYEDDTAVIARRVD